MSQTQLTMNVRSVSPELRVIDIRGELNALASNYLTDAFSRASESPVKIIALNFADLGYMNSSGIGLLVTLMIRAQRQHQQLIAFELAEHYRQIFELTRLNEAITLYLTEAEALAALTVSRA